MFIIYLECPLNVTNKTKNNKIDKIMLTNNKALYERSKRITNLYKIIEEDDSLCSDDIIDKSFSKEKTKIRINMLYERYKSIRDLWTILEENEEEDDLLFSDDIIDESSDRESTKTLNGGEFIEYRENRAGDLSLVMDDSLDKKNLFSNKKKEVLLHRERYNQGWNTSCTSCKPPKKQNIISYDKIPNFSGIRKNLNTHKDDSSVKELVDLNRNGKRWCREAKFAKKIPKRTFEEFKREIALKKAFQEGKMNYYAELNNRNVGNGLRKVALVGSSKESGKEIARRKVLRESLINKSLKKLAVKSRGHKETIAMQKACEAAKLSSAINSLNAFNLSESFNKNDDFECQKTNTLSVKSSSDVSKFKETVKFIGGAIIYLCIFTYIGYGLAQYNTGN